MASQPNVIIILADDMGYGDLTTNNPTSKIPTPNLDRLAYKGMRFTDAHASSSVCTPSRYSLLTGRYAWRSRLKSKIVYPWDGSLIEPDRDTLAHLLRRAGYRTACIGKWHLGMDWPTRDGSHPNDSLPFGEPAREPRAAYGANIDFSGRLGGGPVDCGFDSYFGVDVPNFPPYTWIEDDHVTATPTREKPPELVGLPGPAISGWSPEAMIPEFTSRAVELIETQAQSDQPFFLYFPLTSPHSPIAPNEPFRGVSGCGMYGDFVCEIDWIIGEILSALERTGTADTTLLAVTSDNGPEGPAPDNGGAYERIREFEHYSMGEFRGIKRDLWEGGHRIPLLVHWPERVAPGAVCDGLVSLQDWYATLADLLHGETAEDSDSVSMLAPLNGADSTRKSFVHHSFGGSFALRRDNWVLIDAPTGDENEEPAWFRSARGYAADEHPRQLFDLEADVAESVNRYAADPDVAAALSRELESIKVGN